MAMNVSIGSETLDHLQVYYLGSYEYKNTKIDLDVSRRFKISNLGK